MRPLIPLLAVAALALPASASADQTVRLDPLGGSGPGGEATAEIAAFDPGTDRAFATNARDNALDVYDVASGTPRLLGAERISLAPYGAGPNSVAVSRRCGLVAVAVEADPKTAPGRLAFFDTRGRFRFAVTVGALPDMVTFTPDGRTALVANEGEPIGYGPGETDPEGSVSVVSLLGDCSGATVRTAGLGGVRLDGPVRIFGPGATPAQDLEPEYVATDGRTAWVTMQENDAVGILDVARARFEVVRGLGFKDHGQARNALDPSDRDGGISIRPRPGVFGMYQPDAISLFSARGRSYLVTANEGDARDYDGFSEEARVKSLPLDPQAFPAGAKADAQLGRLTVTTTQGDTDGDGDFDRLFPFGARSLSVLDASAALVGDTGAALEEHVARVDPATFNMDSEPSAIDDRSDNKGPEPEGVAVGELRGRPYAFLGAERQGGIFAIDLSGTPGSTRIAAYANTRPADLGPEGLAFVDAKDSPTGEALLLVTNEVSGTLASYAVRPVAEPHGGRKGR